MLQGGRSSPEVAFTERFSSSDRQSCVWDVVNMFADRLSEFRRRTLTLFVHLGTASGLAITTTFWERFTTTWKDSRSLRWIRTCPGQLQHHGRTAPRGIGMQVVETFMFGVLDKFVYLLPPLDATRFVPSAMTQFPHIPYPSLTLMGKALFQWPAEGWSWAVLDRAKLSAYRCSGRLPAVVIGGTGMKKA